MDLTYLGCSVHWSDIADNITGPGSSTGLEDMGGGERTDTWHNNAGFINEVKRGQCNDKEASFDSYE